MNLPRSILDVLENFWTNCKKVAKKIQTVTGLQDICIEKAVEDPKVVFRGYLMSQGSQYLG